MFNTLLAIFVFNLSPAFGAPSLMPAQWDYQQQGASHLWRSPDRTIQTILVDYTRTSAIPTSVQDLADQKLEILEARIKTLETMGFRKIAYDYWKTSPLGKSIVLTEIRFRYLSPGGVWQASHEKLYSTANKVRLTAVTYPLHQKRVRSVELLKRLAPAWRGRQIATDSGLEASVCCQNEGKTKLAIDLSPFNKTFDPKLPLKDQPLCKDVHPEDLQGPKDAPFDFTSLYSESKLATPIGCVQGIYEMGTKVLTGVHVGLSAAGSFVVDTKYREEVAAVVGYGASALWNDPVGVSQKVINALIAEVAQNWGELACLNRRASARAVCQAVMGLIVADKAFKVLKVGLSEVRKNVPGVAEVLKKSLTGKAPVDAVKAAAPTPTAASVTTSALAEKVKAVGPNTLPFETSLVNHLEQANKFGSLNDELIISRIEQLSSSTTRDRAYDDLRRLDYVLSALLKEPGETLSKKIDTYLQKQVTDPKERDLLRNCLIKKP